jgi:hypothetical protein
VAVQSSLDGFYGYGANLFLPISYPSLFSLSSPLLLVTHARSYDHLRTLGFLLQLSISGKSKIQGACFIRIDAHSDKILLSCPHIEGILPHQNQHHFAGLFAQLFTLLLPVFFLKHHEILLSSPDLHHRWCLSHHLHQLNRVASYFVVHLSLVSWLHLSLLIEVPITLALRAFLYT